MEFIKKNFLAICILISAFMLSIAIIFSALCSRYYFVENSGNTIHVFDRLLGTTYIISGGKAVKLTIQDIINIMENQIKEQENAK